MGVTRKEKTKRGVISDPGFTLQAGQRGRWAGSHCSSLRPVPPRTRAHYLGEGGEDPKPRAPASSGRTAAERDALLNGRSSRARLRRARAAGLGGDGAGPRANPAPTRPSPRLHPFARTPPPITACRSDALRPRLPLPPLDSRVVAPASGFLN